MGYVEASMSFTDWMKLEIREKKGRGRYMQCPECGTTGMTRYSKEEVEAPEVLWSCVECGWIGKQDAIKTHETTHAKRFFAMCEESLCPEYFDMLLDKIIPAIQDARRITII